MAIENKAPGKDISPSDLVDKFPLVAKKSANHKSHVEVKGVVFGDSHADFRRTKHG